MFGSKNKENLETIDNLTKQLAEKTKVTDALEKAIPVYEGEVDDFTRSAQRMEEDLSKFSENLDASGALLSENAKDINRISELLKEITEVEDNRAKDFEAYLGKLSQTYVESMNAVENNKHFTAPSKNLTDISETFRRGYQEDSREIKLMAEYSKQMGVLSLNAAIEAGRMGDSGREFVTACESIRNYVTNYEKSIRAMQERMEENQKKIAELDEEVRKLNALMKDNNMTATKMMKTLNELGKEGEGLKESQSSNLAEQAHEKLESVWERESKIDKAEARNRLELEDVQEESELQRKNMTELTKALGDTISFMKN